MTNEPLDLNKPVRTRDGLPARIIATDRKNPNFPVVALVAKGGSETACFYTKSGKIIESNFDHPFDLVNVPETYELWVNVYKDLDGKLTTYAHPNKSAAEYGSRLSSYSSIARRKLVVTEGQFDE